MYAVVWLLAEGSGLTDALVRCGVQLQRVFDVLYLRYSYLLGSCVACAHFL